MMNDLAPSPETIAAIMAWTGFWGVVGNSLSQGAAWQCHGDPGLPGFADRGACGLATGPWITVLDPACQRGLGLRCFRGQLPAAGAVDGDHTAPDLGFHRARLYRHRTPDLNSLNLHPIDADPLQPANRLQ